MRDVHSSPVQPVLEPAPWLVIDERLPWPGFTQREWDGLLFLRWLVRTGRVTGDAERATR